MFSLRKLVLTIFPAAVYAVWHGFVAIRDVWMLHDHASRSEWFWERFVEVVIFVLSVWANVGIPENPDWPSFIAESLIEPLMVALAIDDSCHTTFWLFYGIMMLPKYILYAVFFAVIASFRFVKVAQIFSGFIAFWSTILFLEVVADEVIAFWRKFDRPPAVSSFETRYWEVLSFLRSSNNGYLARQFRPIRIIDHTVDDPFWPNVSSVYVVEIRRRNLIWRQITIWRVSLLNGGKKKIETFNHVDQDTDGQPFSRQCKFISWIEGYQHKEVLLIVDPIQTQPPFYVYDLRYGKSHSYILPLPPDVQDLGPSWIASVSCLRRLFSSDGSLCGWRIQVLTANVAFCYCHGTRIHSGLRKIIYDLRDKAVLVSYEDIIFGRCMGLKDAVWRSVRTSRGHVGLFCEVKSASDGQSILYDPFIDQFVHLPDFDTLLQIDRPFALYNFTPSPMGTVHIGDEFGCLNPAVLTDQECIECVKEDIVFCTRFKAPSIKYFAAKSLFMANPNLRSEMTAEEFRVETGIGGMEAHFDR